MSRRRSNDIDVGSTVLVDSPLPVGVLIKTKEEMEGLLQVVCSRYRRLSGRVYGMHVKTAIKWIKCKEILYAFSTCQKEADVLE